MGACRVNPERLSALVDGEVSGDEREALLAHAEACERCGRELEALRTLREGVAALGAPEPVSPGEWEQVWSGVRERLPVGLRPVPARTARRTLPIWLRVVPRPALAAAALVMALAVAGLVALVVHPPGGEGLAVAQSDDVRLESIAYDCDDYTLVVMAPAEGGAPVLWLTPIREHRSGT